MADNGYPVPVVENDGCRVFQIHDETGEGTMTQYDLFPGVSLMYNDFHMESCESEFYTTEDLLCIDYCRQGRMEYPAGLDAYSYVEAGDLKLDRRLEHRGHFTFPLSHYHGITIGFILPQAAGSLAEWVREFPVNLGRLQEKFCSGCHPKVIHRAPSVDHIFQELYAVPEQIKLPYFRIKVLELLLYLDALELDGKTEKPYFYKSQVEKVKAAHRLLTEDLERHSGSEESCGDKETLRTISRNTNRLIRHVNELLDLSVLTRGVPSPHIVCADLSRFLKEISETFIPLADSYKIAFTYSIAPDISIAYFDKNILEQVLYNLLSNAFKYTPDGGSVSFSALLEQSSSDAVMTLRITDSGIGIPPESLPYIFDQYYKGESIAFRRSESSGIGLAYTKELLELHKATIQCESELGKGSVFTVALPISEEAYPEEWLEYSEPKMEEASLRESVPLEGTNPVPENLRQTLLFVEDNEDLCRYLMNAFQTDYRVVIAKNGKVGLEKAMEILPDVIVSDVMMPVMNGIECCEALKMDERTAHIPVILLTALAEERQQLEGYGAGADDYLPKPFSLAVLKAKIKNLLKRSEQLKLYFRDRFDLRTPEQTIADPDKEFLSKVTKVVLAHLQDPEFDVELFCSEMAMSRASLFRKLKSTTGCSASSFTRNIRIKRAAELLGQHAYSIGEVAAQVGFSDPNYFTRCFKEIYGITPSEFIQTSPSSQDSHSPLASSGK